MAVNRVSQREIVEVPYQLPDGSIKPHMALVLSTEKLLHAEEGMFYAVLISSKNINPEFTMEIRNEWLNKPLSKQSYFVTHIVSQFNCDDVIARHNCFLRQPFFDQVIDRIIGTIIDGDWKKNLYPKM